MPSWPIARSVPVAGARRSSSCTARATSTAWWSTPGYGAVVRRRPRVTRGGGARWTRPASAGPRRVPRRRGSARGVVAGVRGSMRSSTTSPFARNSRIHSPYGSWNDDLVVLDPVHPEVVEDEAVADRPRAPERPADGLDRRVVVEREQAAGAEQPCRLRDRPVRVGEGHRPVVAEDDVERRVGERDGLGAAVDQREVDAGLRPSAGGRARADAPRGRARPAGRRAAPGRSTTARRRTRTRGCPCPRRRRGRGAPPPGSGYVPQASPPLSASCAPCSAWYSSL